MWTSWLLGFSVLSKGWISLSKFVLYSVRKMDFRPFVEKEIYASESKI